MITVGRFVVVYLHVVSVFGMTSTATARVKDNDSGEEMTDAAIGDDAVSAIQKVIEKLTRAMVSAELIKPLLLGDK